MDKPNPEFFGLSEKRFAKALQLISHIIPRNFGHPGNIHQHIVREGMVLKGSGKFSLKQIQSSIKQKLQLQFELLEIEYAINALIEKGEVIQPEEGKYQLTEKTYQDWTEKNDERKKIRTRILNEWIEEISRIHSLSDEEVSYLILDLETYTAKLLETHGAECTALLYPGKNHGQVSQFLKKVSREVLPCLPTKNRSGRLIRIRSVELPRFYEESPRQRKMYIAELLDSAFIYHILHLDPKCSEIVREQLQEITLYLDTNVLYRLFGLESSDLQEAIRGVLEICKKMEMKVLVAEVTIDEYKKSLNNDIKILKQYKIPPKSFAEIGAKLSNRDSFVNAYWRKYAKAPISPDDFIGIYIQVESLLQQEEILIDYKSKDQLKSDLQLAHETVNLMSFIADHNRMFRRFLTRQIHKSPPVLRHDAYLRFLVNKKRRGKPQSFTNTKTWLLTCDRTLILYDYYLKEKGKEKKSTMNTSVMPHQWLQILRPLLPRTEDYNATFANLLSSPYLRSYGTIPSRIPVQVLATASQVEKIGPQIAAKLLTDMFLSRQMALLTDEREERQTLRKAIERAKRETKEEQRELAERKLGKYTKRKKPLYALGLSLILTGLFGISYIVYVIISNHPTVIPLWVWEVIGVLGVLVGIGAFINRIYTFVKKRRNISKA